MVSFWLYKIERYFVLMQVAHANIVLFDANRITSASGLIAGSTAL